MNEQWKQWALKKNPDLIDRKVIEDIKAEINELSELDHENDGEYGSYEDCKFDVLQIIDKHISGKEQE